MFFLTIVTHDRRRLFDNADHVSRLRGAMRQVHEVRPFVVEAAVVLPDHLHFIWRLPDGDSDYSSRVGQMKVLFTRSLRTVMPSRSRSRVRHREAAVWQRRFWEHRIRGHEDFVAHLAYIHYNPVKHGYVKCPHSWPYSSFEKWVANGYYPPTWGCVCDGSRFAPPAVIEEVEAFGE